MVSFLKDYLQKKFNSLGFNINFDSFEVDNQSYFHVHIHILPFDEDKK